MDGKTSGIFSRINFFFGLVIILVVVLANTPISQIPEAKKGKDLPVLKEERMDSVIRHFSLRDSIELLGRSFLGTPYVYGGTGKSGFDCSGLVYRVFSEFGIKVPRTSSRYADFGTEVPITHVKKGDILVFLSPTRNAIGHLGIVTEARGRESTFIHASSGKEMRVMISSLNQPGYARRFVKAVSVLEKSAR